MAARGRKITQRAARFWIRGLGLLLAKRGLVLPLRGYGAQWIQRAQV